MPLVGRAGAAVDRLFGGTVDPRVYAAMRIGLAAIFLVRHADWLRPLLFLQHHRWVHGLDFSWSIGAPPYLVSPLVPGLALGPTSTYWLVRIRTALAVLLLCGVRARFSAVALALVSYLLLAADRYRYLNHLHLLYLGILWLSLAPLGDRFGLDGAFRRFRKDARGALAVAPASGPLWPLQMLRALVLGVYLAAGLAKLEPVWLAGGTLRALERIHVLRGAAWSALRDGLGYACVARLAAATELGLAAGLAAPVTRRVAVLVAIVFHAGIGACMMVSTFGVEMAVLLLAFVPAAMPVAGTGPILREKTI